MTGDGNHKGTESTKDTEGDEHDLSQVWKTLSLNP